MVAIHPRPKGGPDRWHRRRRVAFWFRIIDATPPRWRFLGIPKANGGRRTRLYIFGGVVAYGETCPPVAVDPAPPGNVVPLRNAVAFMVMVYFDVPEPDPAPVYVAEVLKLV